MRRLPALLVLALGACAPPGSELESQRQEIVGGTTASDPSVLLIVASVVGSESVFLCTGTIVSPHVVLSAAHCVDPRIVGNATFQVMTGNVLTSSSTFKPVKEVHFDAAFDPTHLENGHDISVLVLQQAADAAPLRINRVALDRSDIGVSVRAVGFGITVGSDTAGTTAGTKRQITTALLDFDGQLLLFGDSTKNTCEGDSGGPAFIHRDDVEVVAGVTSFGDSACVVSGYDTRVDVYAASYVEPFMRQFDPSFNISQPASNFVPGTTGSSCTAASQCQSGICVTGACSQACEVDAMPDTCPIGTQCSVVDKQPRCVRLAGGGCSLGGAGRAPAPLAVLLMFVVCAGLRRRARQ